MKMKMKMELSKRLMIKAEKLVAKLQQNITTGRRKICENYGQKEIRRFKEKELHSLQYGALSYQEECSVLEVLYKVSSIC